jgi:hypothetical protein
MRFVQALHWLRDMLPSDDGSIRKRLITILTASEQGQAIQDDLNNGLSAMPVWMQSTVRDLLRQANPGGQPIAGSSEVPRDDGTQPPTRAKTEG